MSAAFFPTLPLESRLVHAITELDRKRSAKDRHWNRHFLGLAFQALEGFTADAESIGDERAFCDRFTPSREMHAVARRVSLPLKVDRGRWILSDGSIV